MNLFFYDELFFICVVCKIFKIRWIRRNLLLQSKKSFDDTFEIKTDRDFSIIKDFVFSSVLPCLISFHVLKWIFVTRRFFLQFGINLTIFFPQLGRQERQQVDLLVRRLLHLSLVPRHGTRVIWKPRGLTLLNLTLYWLNVPYPNWIVMSQICSK